MNWTLKNTMKDPMYQLSEIFLLILQCLVAMSGALFFVLGILAFNGMDFINFILKIFDEPYRFHSDQMWMTGFLFMGKALISLIFFVVLTYLKKVIHKEMNSGPPFQNWQN